MQIATLWSTNIAVWNMFHVQLGNTWMTKEAMVYRSIAWKIELGNIT